MKVRVQEQIKNKSIRVNPNRKRIKSMVRNDISVFEVWFWSFANMESFEVFVFLRPSHFLIRLIFTTYISGRV